MFNVILSNGAVHKAVFKNMKYIDALNIASHLNTLTTAAAKATGKVIKNVFSVEKANNNG